MRFLKRLVLTASFVGLSASAGFAQQQTVTTGGGVTSSTITGTGGLTGGQAGQLGQGGAGALGGSQLGGIALQTMQTAPTIAPPTGTTGGGGGSVDPVLGAYYANPYYQGLLANAAAAPGGFGTALYGTTGGAGRTGGVGMRTTATGVRTGATATGTTGATGFAGGQAALQNRGAAGRTGLTGNLASQSAVVVPLPVQLTYPAVAQFATAPLAATQVQADVTGMISRSVGSISNPAGVTATVGQGNNVVLRGAVRDAEEARLVEGMVRLTPGVALVKNELTFPAPALPVRP